MQPTVLVLGARGRFGLAAARAFADAGWRVWGHMRPGAHVPHEVQDDARIQCLPVDLGDTAALAAAARGSTVVVHALNPAYTQRAWKQEVLPMTEAALSLARALGATLMVPGNVYNFGAGMPGVLTEETPQNAQTVKGHIRIGMEAQLQRSGVRCVLIRAGDFFGSGRGTWFDQVITKDLRKGVWTTPGPLDVETAWAYLPDLARTFVAVAEKRASLSHFERFHFTGHTLSARQWLDCITPLARAQGWIAPDAALRSKRVPWPLLRVGALWVPTWAALVEMRYLWETPHALSNGRLLALLGAEPHTPLSVAAQNALADLDFVPALPGSMRHATA